MLSYLLIAVVLILVLGVAVALMVQRMHSASEPLDDPLVHQVLAALPGANCGLCGNDSCFAAAEGIARGALPPGICIAGGAETRAAVTRVLLLRSPGPGA